MIRSLYIKNYAIIDELNIDFNKGFNVFTGETGAGKSIIIGALSLLIKGKADTSFIKTGENKTIIEGVFDIEEYMKPILDDASIDYDDELIVRRVISSDNKNTIKINQCSVTLNFLTEILSDNIDIHSQKDNQYLLNKKNHIDLLDKYAKHFDLLNDYKDKYEKYIKLKHEYDELVNNKFNERDIEFTTFDFNELNNAKLNVNEENSLIEKEKRYKDSEKYLTLLNNSKSLFEDEGGIKDKISSIIKELNIDDDSIRDIKNNIENIYYSLTDEIDKLKDILNSISDEEIDIDAIEERLYLYSKLKRKHNTDIEGLIAKKDELENKIKFFEDKDSLLKEKEDELLKNQNICILSAKKLSESRKKYARLLQHDIEKQCEDLMLKNVRFVINIVEDSLNKKGLDDVEFYISLNKNEDVKPLKNIASGGEISRLMLALKTIFAKLSNCILVIFDEIDTGVSGKVGLAVGKKMKAISKDVQTIAITHLASVAACGDYHYFIYKTDNSNTRINKLDYDERIKELASISSTEISKNTIEAAKELYEIAQNEN